MRLAVIQLAARRGARSLTLQRALRAVDAAARSDPAPDLVLLPAFSDVTASPAEADLLCEHVHGQTQAALGRAAREWGVFVAFGMLECSPAAALPYLTGVLIDPDGDVCLSQRTRTVTGAVRDRIQAGASFRVADTVLGRIALLPGDDAMSDACWIEAAAADLVLCTACHAAWPRAAEERDILATIARLAGRAARPAALADLTVEGSDGTTAGQGTCAVFDATGRACPAEADSRGIMWADVEITPSAQAGVPVADG